MVKVALFVGLEAKPGKEAAVEDFLKSGLPLVQQEPATTTWSGRPTRRPSCRRSSLCVSKAMALNRDPIAFPKLDDEQVSALGKFATLKSFVRGETLFAAGERDFKFFIVKSGEVAIVDRSSGQDENVTVHEAREFTGDVDMLTGRAVLVSAIARTDCKAYEISAADLRRILSEMPRLSDVLLRAFLMRRELFEESGALGVRVVGSRYALRAVASALATAGMLYLDQLVAALVS